MKKYKVGFWKREKSKLALSDRGSYYNEDEWQEEYDHDFYYDSTEKGNDESDATDNDYSLSESDYSSTNDELYEAIGKIILGQDKGTQNDIKCKMSEYNLQNDFSSSFAITSLPVFQNMLKRMLSINSVIDSFI